ncbi:hypothetical protein CA267_007525 [Alteromonas pelagimontana]|uniref:Class IIb bacteriocin, lactobin A/cerein 7B family n=1 Tax=Alteromonas pelagimontana TaxID=1858656 RepID=A0A6M4MC73_9ALTE|nr:hypothetical protein [Alteromonas pelagimontana]QJR80639.1 hypothetical protein CA267_007525 [Alteromonas pelagimontana]
MKTELSANEIMQVSGGMPLWFAVGGTISTYNWMLDQAEAFGRGLGLGFYDGMHSRR